MSIAWDDVVTAFIASVAAGISLLTFVYQYALKPRLVAQIGQEILVHYTAAGQLILTATFVFMNRGALPTAMTGLFGTIWADSSINPDAAKLEDPNLIWGQYEEVKRITPIGEKAEYGSGSSGVVETLVIPGRGASSPRMIRLFSKRILPLESLYSKDGLAPEPRVYMLVLRAVDGSTRGTRGTTLTCRLFLNKQDRDELRDNGKESEGEIKSRILFRRKLSSARPRESLTESIRSKIPFRRRPARAAIIDFVSDGKWSRYPTPPRIPSDQTNPLPPPGNQNNLLSISRQGSGRHGHTVS